MGIFDFFKTKQQQQTTANTTGQQQGQQSGQSQSNLWPQLGGYFDNFAATAFTPQGPNQYQTGAAEQQAALGSALAPAFQSAWNVAGQGIQDSDISRFSNQYDTSVINNMIADFQKQNAQTLDANGARRAAQGALGNKTGADALVLQGAQGAQADAIMKARQGGFNTATGLARDNAALQLQGAGQLGQLGSVASGINQAGFGMGQTLWNNPFAQFGQVSSAISPWAQAAGQNYSGQSSGTSSGTQVGNTTTTGGPSPFQAIMGLGTLGLGGLNLFNNWGKAHGGAVKGYAFGGGVGASSFADKVRAAHEVVSAMQSGGKVKERAFDSGGWVTNTRDPAGALLADDPYWDGIRNTALGDHRSRAINKFTTDMAPTTFEAMGKPTEPSGDNRSLTGAFDTLGRFQQDLGQFLGRMPKGYSGGGAPGMYAGGDPDAEAAYDNDGYDMVPFGTTLDYEPSYVAPKGSPYGGALPGFAARPAFMDPTPPAAPPAAAPEVAGARYDAPMPPPRYEPTVPPRERSFGENLTRALDRVVGPKHYDDPVNTLMRLTGAASGPNILGPAVQQWNKHRESYLADKRAQEEAARQYAALTGQLPATMGGGETLAARQLARQLEADKAAEQHRTRVWEETMRHNREQEIPAVVKQVEAMGYPRGTPEHNAMVRKIIEKADRGETEFDKGIGKASAADLEKRADAIRAGQGKIQSLNQMETLVNDPRLQNAQGKYAGWWLEGKKIAQALGFPMEGVKEAEALRALGNQFALQLRSTAGGEGMPGALSDQDRNFLLASVPGLENTPGGNRVMIKMMREVENYKIRANTEAQKYISERKSNVGLGDYMNQWMQQNPMLSETTRKEAQKVLETTQQQPDTVTTSPDTAAPELPTLTPEQAKTLPPGTRFRGTDGKVYRVPGTAAEASSVIGAP